MTKTENHLVYLSIGSNMGDRYSNCLKGIRLLEKADAVIIMEQSPFYMTKPVDYLDQDWFINGVVKLKTTLAPFPLLRVLKEIEKKNGRKSGGLRFGPRILDMDIIFYDDFIMNHDELVIPHPRMHKRCFVLKPLCDIDPGVVHPVFNKAIQSLLSNIDGCDQEVIPL